MDNNAGLQHYVTVDDSRDNDARNLGAGRTRTIGAIVHSTSGASSLSWLTTGAARAGAPASADFLIDKNGTRHALCPAGRFPYHAGTSIAFDAMSAYADDMVSKLFVGIEIEYRDTERPTYAQYDSLAECLTFEALKWGWRWPYVLYGHYAIARPLGRRSDPVSFDWGALQGRLYVWSMAAGIPGLV